MISRRRLLASGAALTLGWSAAPVLAKTRSVAEPRFALLILRGGMDGLAAVPAYGDPHYLKTRGPLADLQPGGLSEPMYDLDGFFGLHPQFQQLHSLYLKQELAVLHAVAPPYRQRSHFDGQDVLEAGIVDPSGSSNGWLYRALTIATGKPAPDQYAMALGGAVPLVLQGAKPVGAWAPDRLPAPDDDTMARVLSLYAEDAILGPRLDAALRSEMMTGAMNPGRNAGRNPDPNPAPRGDALALTARAAADFLCHPDGPRVAVIESGGWDTHANQLVQLTNRFRALDSVVGAFRGAMGSVWADTMLVMVTEFGRTAGMNGTRGSDHGVGGAAFIAGGAVRGGRVLTDWPGLGPSNLYQGRDLEPTTDMRSLFKTALVGHLRMDANAVDEVVFPDSRVPMLDGLLKS